ncbi:MAG: hypothetical protein U0325_34995 [Polyangiales bacterium]
MAEPGSGGHHFDPARMVARFDRNGDGRTTLDELPPRMRERVSPADVDHDGAISAQEFTTHLQTMRAERFRRADTNSDGAITADEAGERWARIGRADANHDGRVTADELQGAFAQMRGRHHGPGGEMGPRGEHGPGWDPSRRLARFDANGNGQVEVNELPERMQQRLGAADANRDGVLTAEEMRAFFEARHAERLREMAPAEAPEAPAEE